MTEIFTAPLGTFIVNREKGTKTTIKTPVVAFTFIQIGSPVFPLCAMPFGGLTAGKALLHDSGYVSDPHAGLVFGTLVEWEALVDTAAYWKEALKPSKAENAKTADSAGLSNVSAEAMTRDDETETERAVQVAETVRTAASTVRKAYEKSGGVDGVIARAKVIPDKPQRNRKPRIFETNSWWMFPADDNAVARRIWMIPGGEVVPFDDDPDYTKIKQVEFAALKKEGWTVGDPRDEAPVEDDDDDHGKNLI